jgi:hypothetical protein
VAGEAHVDVYFKPTSPPPKASHKDSAAHELGLLGRIAQIPCLLEPFRNQPTFFEIRSCLRKLYQVHGGYQRKSKREKESLQESDLPYLWILASSASENLLNGFGAFPSKDWEPGIYFLHPLMVLTQAYLEWEQQIEQKGRQEGEQSGAL